MGVEIEITRLIINFLTKTEDKNYYSELALLIEQLAFALGRHDVIHDIEELTTNIKVVIEIRGAVFLNETFATLSELEEMYYKYKRLRQD